MVLRLLAAAGAAGVERALVSTDGMGVAGGVARGLAKRRASAGRLPAPRVRRAGGAHRHRRRHPGARPGDARPRRGVIVTLGGDGTVRAAAATAGTSRCCPCRPAPTTPSPRCGRRPSPAPRPACSPPGGSTPTRSPTARRCCTSGAGRRARGRAGRRVRLHRHARRRQGAVAARDPARALLRLRRAARDRPVQHRRPAAPGGADRSPRRRRHPRRSRDRGPDGVRPGRARRRRPDRGGRDARGRSPASRTGSPWSAAPSRSTASARSSSAPAPPSPSPSRPTGRACSTCASRSPTPPRAGSSSTSPNPSILQSAL